MVEYAPISFMSFMTNKLVPGDFDACWEANGVDIGKLKSMYGGELFPAGWPADSAGNLFLDFFQMDRDGRRKGIISVDLVRWKP
jgi:hypothetical protein